VGHVWGGGVGRWSMTWDHGRKDSCCKRGADRRGVCDGLIGAFHGGWWGVCKSAYFVHLLPLRILVCAAFFDFLF